MYGFTNGRELLELTERHHLPISEVVIRYEAERSEAGRNRIIGIMERNLAVMEEAVRKGMEGGLESPGGLIGHQAGLLRKRLASGKSLTGHTVLEAVAMAIAVTEVNASMGRIVAAPTAGSCGIIPAAIFAAAKSLEAGREEMVKGLFTAAGIGIIIAENATLAGAEGGCQAECGSAAAMAAAAVVEMSGGTPRQCLDAAAYSLKNIMGLVCDPIAGLVEVPCSKRNGLGVVNALISAEMALAGIESVIPFDEVVESMAAVGRALPCELRETALGGIAATPTAKGLERKIFNR